MCVTGTVVVCVGGFVMCVCVTGIVVLCVCGGLKCVCVTGTVVVCVCVGGVCNVWVCVVFVMSGCVCAL